MTLRLATAATHADDHIAANLSRLENTPLDAILAPILHEEMLPKLAAARQLRHDAGFLNQALELAEALRPRMFLEPTLCATTNAGGANPRECARAVASVFAAQGAGDLPVGIVMGDNFVDRLEEVVGSGCPLDQSETGEPFDEVTHPVVAAYAHLGAEPVTQVLRQGARFVVAGHVDAASLAVAQAVCRFDWAWDAWDLLASAAVAGDLLGIRGGVFPQDSAIQPLPILVEIADLGQVHVSTIGQEDGDALQPAELVASLFCTTSATASGLARKLHPDVDADRSTLQVASRDAQKDVVLWGVTGRPRAESYVASLYYEDGFVVTDTLLMLGSNAPHASREFAHKIEEGLKERVGEDFTCSVQLPGYLDNPSGNEVGPQSAPLQLVVTTPHRAIAEDFARQIQALALSGNPNIIRLHNGAPDVRPHYTLWPTVVPREFIEPQVEIRSAEEWV